MSLLKKLTIKNLILNKKRTIVTIIGIILSVALITAVATMYASAIDSLIEFETNEKGKFHYAFYDVPVSEISKFENNRKIEKIDITKHIGYAKLEDSKNEYKPYAHIMAFTKDSLEDLSVKLVEGKLPENENEIIIPTHLKTNGRIVLNVGDNITLDVGMRVSNGETLTQDTPYNEEIEENIINTTSKTFKIVGIIERPATNIENMSAPGYTFITYLDNNNLSDKVDIYTKYTKEGLKDQYKVTANILGVNEEIFEKVNSGKTESTRKDLENYTNEMEKAKYEINVNSYLISLETNPFDANSVGALDVVVIIVCGIIVFTSVFCIKNSFNISITEKTKQYGMLKSIGATKKQIKKNVLFEAFILGIIGIPLGILSGFLASYILIIICRYFLNELIQERIIIEFAVSWIAVLFSVVLGIITIYLSAIGSSKRASKVSPIDSIRNSGNIKIKSKKLKSLKIIHKVFGIGGDISYKNLKRNKKKYRTTVISIIVSVATFIALYSFMDLAFLEVKNEFKTQDYNLSVSVDTNKDEGIYNKVIETTKFDDVEEFTILNETSFQVSNPNFSEEYKKTDDYDKDEDETYITICSIGENSYKKYLKELGLNYENLKDKAILVDMKNTENYDETQKKMVYKNMREFTYNKGEKISGKIIEEKDKEYSLDLDIGFVTDKKPFGLSNLDGAILIVSDEMYNMNLELNKSEYVNIYFKNNNADKLQDEIYNALNGFDDLYINNINENVKMMNNFYTLIAIFLYGFIIVISLIGITNIFNTITTNMELRKPEFASLKSIGMTTKEFNRMIRLESIFMGVKSLLFGIPIGICFSYLIYHNLVEDSGMAYPIPFFAIIVSVIAVFLLITCIMRYSINKINKQNTIETIRNENI